MFRSTAALPLRALALILLLCVGAAPLAGGAQAAPAATRYIIFIDGFSSSNQTTSKGKRDTKNQQVLDDFALTRAAIASALPDAKFIYFSYRAGPNVKRLNQTKVRQTVWVKGDYFQQPIYTATDTAKYSLDVHVQGLDWLIKDLLKRDPAAQIDIVGYSLGGAVAARWAQGQSTKAGSPILAVHRLVLLDSPVGGISKAASLVAADLLGDDSPLAEELREGSKIVKSLRSTPKKVDVAAVENADDYLVNGKTFSFGPLFSSWIGKGARKSFLKGAYFRPLGSSGTDTLEHLFQTHGIIMLGEESDHPALAAARAYLVQQLTTDGSLWRARHPASRRVQGLVAALSLQGTR